MTEDDIKGVIFDVLHTIAPEADFATLAPTADLREALDLSMDFMNFVVGLHERTGLAIPEADYPRLRTLDAATAYIAHSL